MTYRLWTPDEDQRLVRLVNENRLSYREMASQFPGRSATSLLKHARNGLNLTRDGFVYCKHSYDKTFFSVPNPVNCYVAGYWAADGHVTDNPTTRVVAIELSHEEWHQLETFKQLMRYSGLVKDSSYPNGHEGLCALRLYGEYQLANDLETHFGVTPRKTHRLPAPSLTDPRLKLCYLAGLLDGDGCVHISTTDRLSISYTSASEAIVLWVKQFIESLGLRSLRKDRSGNVNLAWGDTKAWSYQVCGLKAIDLVHRVQALKQDDVPILDRKWDNPRLNEYISTFLAKHELTRYDGPSIIPRRP